MPELQLSFHGTFALKKDDLRRILKAATEEQGLKDSREGLMARTDLGNEKVLRIKSWAIRAGLVSGDRLSPEGEVVWKCDRDEEKSQYLTSPITDWLMHFYLSLGTQGAKEDRKSKYTGIGETLQPPATDPADWGGWTYFVYSFLPQHKAFTLDELQFYCSSTFEPGTGKNPEKDLRENLNLMLRAYTESYALASCKFIRPQDNLFISGDAELPNPYLIGYFLAKLWQRDFGDASSILATDILAQPMGLAAVLGISQETLQTYLNQLETLALLEQRRTVSPAQIIRRWENPLTLLEKAYHA